MYDLIQFLNVYALSPLPAFDLALNGKINLEEGGTYRFFLTFLNKLFGFDFAVYSGGDRWVEVPVPTNVYTVMSDPFADFGYIGIFVFAYSPDNLNAIYFGMIRLKYICLLYVTCGIMEVFTGVIRGTGSTVMPMVVSIFGVCGVRIVWIFTAFQYVHTLDCLYLSYVLSWTFTSLVHFFCYLYIKKKVLKPSDKTIPQAAFKAPEQ